MKKRTAEILIVIAAMLLSACGNQETDHQDNAAVVMEPAENTEEPVATPEEEADSTGEIEKAEGSAHIETIYPEAEQSKAEEVKEEQEPEAESIELVIPAEYADPVYTIGETTRNPDGSVTYKVNEEEHEQLLGEVHAYIQESLENMCALPGFVHFDSMTVNEDCSAFTVVVVDVQTSIQEQESIKELYRLGRMYAVYRGEEPGNIHIDYMTKQGNTFVTRDSEKDNIQG